MQAQLMAVRHGWRWLSAGQLLRDTHDPEIYKYLRAGELVPNDLIDQAIFRELAKTGSTGAERRHILDGYPRELAQAKNLVEHEIQRNGKPQIDAVIVIAVTEAEIMKRLDLRGRMEDNVETIKHRLEVYAAQTQPILDYFDELGVPIEEIDGVGTVGKVHDRIEAALERAGVVEAF